MAHKGTHICVSQDNAAIGTQAGGRDTPLPMLNTLRIERMELDDDNTSLVERGETSKLKDKTLILSHTITIRLLGIHDPLQVRQGLQFQWNGLHAHGPARVDHRVIVQHARDLNLGIRYAVPQQHSSRVMSLDAIQITFPTS